MGCISSKAIARTMSIREELNHGFQSTSSAWEELLASHSDTYNLFAFPSKCNFSGRRFNLDLVNVIKEDSYEMPGTSPRHRGHWMVLIDAAKGSATSPLDLSKYKADFVVFSFYKLFGYSTGIGALIARNESAKLLQKTYFSGGTVAASIADVGFYKRRDGIEEHFEDGTLSFTSIASLHHGFRILNALTMSAISRFDRTSPYDQHWYKCIRDIALNVDPGYVLDEIVTVANK